MQIMKKKILTFFLGILLGCTLIACNGAKDENPANDSQTEDSSQEADSKKPLLDADATDEELLEAIEEDINAVMPERYDAIVTQMKEDVQPFSGQLYQLEGFYTEEDDTSYITNSVEGDETGNRLPLLYAPETPEEGTHIRVTGVVNEGEVNGETVTVLEVVVLEPLK